MTETTSSPCSNGIRKARRTCGSSFSRPIPGVLATACRLFHFRSFSSRKLEPVVKGFSISGPGKRVEALLRSHALISTACFVEVKRYDSPLVSADTYRPKIWQPSRDLSGAVAQVQGTVSAALESWRAQEAITDADGELRGKDPVHHRTAFVRHLWWAARIPG